MIYAVYLGYYIFLLYNMPKQYYSFDEYSIEDSDDDRYSYVSEKSEKTYSSPCRCRRCNKPKKCKPVKECYKCGNQDKCQKKRSKCKSSKCYNTEEKCIIIKIRPCK